MPGEAWFEGLPFSMRGGQDQLVSGSTLAAGILAVPGGGPSSITMQDDPNGRGKVVTFSDGGVTPTSNYQVVISAREQVITNVEDPFIKNVNIPESTAQKLRLTYRINVVPVATQTNKPIPYTDSTIDGNLTNYIEVIPQTSGNGSEVSRTVVSGSEAIDGRNLEITVRNNPAASNPLYPGSPIGNPIPAGSSQQQEYSNGRFIDSLGQEYWLNAIFNDVVSNQVILRLDKEVNQTDPVIIIGKPYKLIKRDVYVTDDSAGSPLGQLFWPVANVEWNSTDGFVHDSKVDDLRNEIEDLSTHEEKTTVKFNIRLLGGGTVTAEPTIKASAQVQIVNNTFAPGDALVIRGVSFVYNVDWVAGVDEAATAANIINAIKASSNPLIANQVLAEDGGPGTIDLEAAIGGTAGNAFTLAAIDGGTVNFSLSGPTFTGGLNATPGLLEWTDDFKIVNPNGVTQLILAGRAVLREGGAAAFMMDLENGGVISKGDVSVTTTSNGSTISLSGSPNLAKVKPGNTLVVGQEVTSITEIDDVNKVVQVSPALVNTGAGFIQQDSYAAGTVPLDSNIYVLAVKTGNIIQVTGRGELEPGESTTSGVPIQLIKYIGATSETDEFPDYSSNNYISDGDSLTSAIGSLDNRLGITDLISKQDRSAKLIKGGIWNWNQGTGALSWTDVAYVQLPGLADSVNTINIDSVTLPSDGYVAYVELNRAAPGGSLTVQTDLVSDIVPTDNTFIIARRVNNDIIVGTGSGGGSGAGLVFATSYDPVSTSLPNTAVVVIDGKTLVNGDTVLFVNLSVDNNRIYEVAGIGTAATWTPLTSFKDNSQTPSAGESVVILDGNFYAGQKPQYTKDGEWLINDTVRFFDGDKGTDFWEISSIKTFVLPDNDTGEIFRVTAAGSENIIVNYSLSRSGEKQLGQLLITSDGTDAHITNTNVYSGDLGITFTALLDGTDLVLEFETSATGDSAVIKYYVQRWSDSPGGPAGIPSYSSGGGGDTPAAGNIGDVQYKGNDSNLAGDSRFAWNATEAAVDLNGLFVGAKATPIILADNNPVTPQVAFTYSATRRYTIIEYSVERDGQCQLGRLLVVTNGTTVSITDDMIATALVGIQFSADISAGLVRLLYTSTTTGFNATFTYSIRRWN